MKKSDFYILWHFPYYLILEVFFLFYIIKFIFWKISYVVFFWNYTKSLVEEKALRVVYEKSFSAFFFYLLFVICYLQHLGFLFVIKFSHIYDVIVGPNHRGSVICWFKVCSWVARPQVVFVISILRLDLMKLRHVYLYTLYNSYST